MADRILADLARNGRERVKVTLSEFKGSRFADVRIYGTGMDGASIPTRQGVSLRSAMLRPVIAALKEAERVLLADSNPGDAA